MFQRSPVAAVCRALFLTLLLICPNAGAVETVLVKQASAHGIPLRAAPQDRQIKDRLHAPDPLQIELKGRDGKTGWLEVSAGDVSGWIAPRYEVRETQAPAETGKDAYVVGCWNLEHFDINAKRGFPEGGPGGKGSYPARTDEDYRTVADIIKSLDIKILVIEEVAARATTEGGEEHLRSAEMDRLISFLGADEYDYVISASGGTQHVAILFDARCAKLEACREMDFPREIVDQSDLFARQPMAAFFAFMDGGKRRNDLVVVGVHLASGQSKVRNHDLAMARIQRKLKDLRDDSSCIPKGEKDILILGDFNTSRFDSYRETFWDDMEKGGKWKVLTSDAYPATRMSGKPLQLKDSRIDYIIATKSGGGLAGNEIRQESADVHTDLLDAVSPLPGYTREETFRQRASDHLPVTVSVSVRDDDD